MQRAQLLEDGLELTVDIADNDSMKLISKATCLLFLVTYIFEAMTTRRDGGARLVVTWIYFIASSESESTLVAIDKELEK